MQLREIRKMAHLGTIHVLLHLVPVLRTLSFGRVVMVDFRSGLIVTGHASRHKHGTTYRSHVSGSAHTHNTYLNQALNKKSQWRCLHHRPLTFNLDGRVTTPSSLNPRYFVIHVQSILIDFPGVS